MERISVKNYRSIKDSGIIELQPLTVIVGRNSAGKSSFIRLFPLLKQTLERKISDSMLWYGDYVDLGEYSQILSKSSKGEPLKMFFSIKVAPNTNKYLFSKSYVDGDYIANVEITIREKFFENIKIEIYDQCIELKMDEVGDVKVAINDDESIFDKYRLVWYRNTGELLPEILEERRFGDGEKGFLIPLRAEEITNKCKKLIYDKKERRENFIGAAFYANEPKFFWGSKQSILERLKRINEEKYATKMIYHKRFLKVNNYIIASNLGEVIAGINQAISNDIKQTNYVKPIRAMVDRYYRVQGVSINELDADGSNLPMILYNMEPRDLKSFERWSKEKFGVVFSVTRGVGHVSLVIRDDVDSEEETNVADTGYGYSQMLPIVMMLWMLHKGNSIPQLGNNSKTIVIEQPELHLHPAYQAKMIDVFINVINEALAKNIDLKIIFETHSEAMINRIGRLISLKKLKPEKVNILVFDKEDDTTKIYSKKFNEKGLLMGWPMGFFATDEVR